MVQVCHSYHIKEEVYTIGTRSVQLGWGVQHHCDRYGKGNEKNPSEGKCYCKGIRKDMVQCDWIVVQHHISKISHWPIFNLIFRNRLHPFIIFVTTRM
jgi:hypothetical protein